MKNYYLNRLKVAQFRLALTREAIAARLIGGTVRPDDIVVLSDVLKDAEEYVAVMSERWQEELEKDAKCTEVAE